MVRNSMEPQEPDRVFTSADRIRELNDIDKDVAKLLNAAGVAIGSLTNSPSVTSGQSSSDLPKIDGTLESHRAAFKAASSQYFALLSSIDVRLRRQVYALEEASIIQPESAEVTAGGTTTTTAAAAAASATSSGGVNPLDTSWLNSRKDTVGKDKEAELWAEASNFATQLEKAKGPSENKSGS
ncbi:Med11 superfamily domain-containing protein [Histoplasma ohiense]|nr:Med11 superfamily domain-containing protein [Histoplasma ohiense (nom. inval.)]